jgi:YbbR domain-containing protein
MNRFAARLQRIVVRLRHNLGLKLMALAIAVLIWAIVGSDPVTEATFRVPVEFLNVPANLELLAETPVVQVWARGPSHAIRQATASDFEVRVDAALVAGPGAHTFSLDPQRALASSPLRVVDVVPAKINVSFERTVSKDVGIDPRLTGEPMPGYRVDSVSVDPAYATVIGPESHVNPLTAASTEPIDLTHVSSKEIFITDIYVPDALVRFGSSKTVKVTINVEREARSRANSLSKSR